jgi:hypothetical protein
VLTRHRAVAALALSIAVLGACGKGEDRPGTSGSASGSTDGPTTTLFKASEATSRIDVTARDYVFEGLPATMAGDKVFFTVRNTGATEHEFEVVGSDGEPVGEVHIDRAKTATVGLKLAPGAYTAQCLIKEGAKTHAELGMKTAFTVT